MKPWFCNCFSFAPNRATPFPLQDLREGRIPRTTNAAPVVDASGGLVPAPQRPTNASQLLPKQELPHLLPGFLFYRDGIIYCDVRFVQFGEISAVTIFESKQHLYSYMEE